MISLTLLLKSTLARHLFFTIILLLASITTTVAGPFIDHPQATLLPAQPDIADMVLIPAGEFIMGSNKTKPAKQSGEFGNAKPWYMDEHPEHKVTLPDYYIDKYEITNAQYRKFIQAVNTTTTPSEHWVDSGYTVSFDKQKLLAADIKILRKLVSKVFKIDIDTRMLSKPQILSIIDERIAQFDKLPVTHTRWHDADAYCKWVNKQLPTEQQWEKAARGPSGQEFTWGNEWKKSMANASGEIWEDGVAPPGSYETDKSPYGVYDLGGNVSEWVANWYQAYDGSNYTSKNFGHQQRVAKGAGWSGTGHYALQLFQRNAYRLNLNPELTFNDVGFRCAKSSVTSTANNH